MSGEAFDAGWLALREPVDHRSRAAPLAARLRGWWRARQGRRVLDLGAGSGSNLRYLRSVLGGAQEWTLVDRDPDLLSRVGPGGPGLALSPVVGDLSERGIPEVSRAELVTASALLDLVSPEWLVSLAEACVKSGCGALFTLSYDGTIDWKAAGAVAWGPGQQTDIMVRDAVNAHQRRDKGMGPALGPDAGRFAETTFRRLGYRTWALPSPWRLGQEDALLAGALVAGWAEAASAQLQGAEDRVQSWAARRANDVASGVLELRVGHVDVLALPLWDPPA